MRGANQVSTFSARNSPAVGSHRCRGCVAAAPGMSPSMKTTLAVVALLTLVFVLSGCGAGKVTVPNVRGKDPGAAYELLHKAGLKVSINGGFSYYSYGSYSGIVQSQQPLAGRVVSRGTNVLTSLGAPGNYGGRPNLPYWPGAVSSGSNCPASMRRVPDLIGKSLAEAVGYWTKCSPVFVISYLAPLTRASGKYLTDNYVVMYQGPAGGAPIPECLAGPNALFHIPRCPQINLVVVTPSRLATLLRHKARRRQAAIAFVFKTQGQPWGGKEGDTFPSTVATRDCSIPTGAPGVGLSVQGQCAASAKIQSDRLIRVRLTETWPAKAFYVQTCTGKTSESCSPPPAFSYSDSDRIHDGGRWTFSSSQIVKVCGDYGGSAVHCGGLAPPTKQLSYSYTYLVARGGKITESSTWGDFPPQFVR